MSNLTQNNPQKELIKKAVRKLLFIVLVPGVLIIISFLIWGDYFEAVFSEQAFIERHSQSHTGWMVGFGLLVGDLVLPVPGTAVMSAMGALYGIWWGALINFSGSCCSGFLAYVLARRFGKKKDGTTRFCSAEELSQYEHFFNKWGAYAIIMSRAFPILPELMTLAAGFSKMDFKKFSFSLMLGSLPVSFLFSYLGHLSRQSPFIGIVSALLISVFLWALCARKIKKLKQLKN